MKDKTRVFSENLNPDLSVEELWTEIINHLTEMMEKHVPTKKTTTKIHQPWICNKLKRASRKKYRAWRKSKTTGDPKDKERAKQLKKETRKVNRQSYQSYVKKSVEEDKNNLYRLIKNKRTDTMGVAPLKRNGLTFSDSKTKADILNDQFCDAFTREDTNNLPQMNNSPHPSMPDITINSNGIQKLLTNLNPRKAAGPYKLP